MLRNIRFCQPFLLLVGSLLGCDSEVRESLAKPEVAEKPTPQESKESFRELGSGFVVWESNRSGDWRIWTRRLDGSGLRQLTPDEGDRQHCCPHISPDGKYTAYVSLPPETKDTYPLGQVASPLHLIEIDGSDDVVIAPSVRTQFENRAVVWRNSRELIYIGEDGRTRSLNVGSGEESLLTEASAENWGWLVNSVLTHATTERPTFSHYDQRKKVVVPMARLGGCQPYFSGDGRWGFWMGAGGGPVYRIDLTSREVGVVLGKSDARMPEGQGYLNFPMFSHDGTLFAVGSSRNQHDHFATDYDIFVARSDALALKPLGKAVRFTSHPANDRYPDVFSQPLPFGRLAGETPFAIDLVPEEGGSWHWDFGDGTVMESSAGRHVYQRPGIYMVKARREDTELAGLVQVAEAAAPGVTATTFENAGQVVVVHFDEQVRLARPEIRFQSGRPIRNSSLAPDGRSLRLELDKEIREPDDLYLAGVSDLAEPPNAASPATLRVEPPAWPSSRERLVFLWQSAEGANLVYDPELEAERACNVEKRGRVFFDHAFSMILGRGVFTADKRSAEMVASACQAKNELTVEMSVEPFGWSRRGRQRIISFGREWFNFYIEQEGDRLFFRKNGKSPALEILQLDRDRASHVVVTYRPAFTAAYLNGELITENSMWFVSKSFANWGKSRLLGFGGQAPKDGEWSGRLEGVAIFNRFLEADEVAENYLRYQRLVERRPAVPREILDAKEIQRSATPTLREIAPYREALMVIEYEVEKVVEGSYDQSRIRVAHWAILDREILPVTSGVPKKRRLVLERLSDNIQLESVFISDTLPPTAPGMTYYFESRPEWLQSAER